MLLTVGRRGGPDLGLIGADRANSRWRRRITFIARMRRLTAGGFAAAAATAFRPNHPP
jgi:hypothetical protein